MSKFCRGKLRNGTLWLAHASTWTARPIILQLSCDDACDIFLLTHKYGLVIFTQYNLTLS